MHKFLISGLTLGAFALPMSTVYADEALTYNVVTLQSEAQRDVANDQMHVVMYLEKTHKQPATLATQVNSLVNQALLTARQYPSVKIETGAQSTSPIYDNDNRKLKEWRTHAQIRLESTDFKATSQLVAALQQNFQTQSLNFSISKPKRAQVENELLVEASKKLQQRAKTLAQAWNKSSYELVSLSVDNHSYSDYAMASPTMAMAKSAAEAENSVVEQQIVAGDSQLTIRVNGTLQLK